ncbi:DUF4139 domain-containing protein [Hasllibacter sp. MH4015]|uniref:DUF4139 domain-containing protein n=1 Tax=Hasllibacter sp. MH4015 TaxID=2854029 RepID=UPI001CD64D50|nr:DUF4139 domain-containing protein [Hasllibacter sp. MH4015]
MTRFLLSTALCATLPLVAHADDIVIRADLAEAIVYGEGADVTRMGEVAIPAGRHRLLIAMPDLDAAMLPQVTGPDGVRFGPPQPLYNQPLEDGALDDPAQAAARADLEAAEDALQAAQDALAEGDALIRAVETQQAYVAAILRGGENGVAMPDDPALVPQFLSTLGAETARLAGELQEARVDRRDMAEAVTDAQTALANASRALQDLRPFGPQINVFAIDVNAAEDVTGEIALSYLTGSASWAPSYELNLDTEAEALSVDRYVTLQTFGAARWQDVAITFSTAAPFREREPSALFPRPARLIAANESGVGRFAEGEALTDAAPAPMAQGGFAVAVEPVVIVEEVAVTAAFDGLSITYAYPTPVTIGTTNQVLLPFDTIELAVETENRAVPRFDETAFLVALTENETGEPILPGEAIFYRDGALIGDGYLPMIPAGAEAEMAFGALDHLQLRWIDRSLAEGDRGLFVSSNTQARALAFGVENTGTEPESVRIMYATPFAEQEDLELDLTLTPRPTEEDMDDMRGVHVWDMDVAPGEETLIEMRVEFEFPEGQLLDWRP